MTDPASCGPALPRFVEGVINYLLPNSSRPQIFPSDHRRNRVALQAHRVFIRDRSAEGAPTDLDVEGYSLVAHRSAICDFESEEERAHTYSIEISTLLQELTGADGVCTFGNGSIRRSNRASPIGVGDSSTSVHFARIELSAAGTAALLSSGLPNRLRNVRRWAICQTWRAVSAQPLDEPLAVCDARSVRPEHLFGYDAHFPGGVTLEGLIPIYDPHHRWSYFSAMGRDDLLIFKVSDTAPELARQALCSTFEDPTCPQAAPGRISLECNACAYWVG